MASVPPNQPTSRQGTALGALLGVGRLALRTGLQAATTNSAIVATAARKAYCEETGDKPANFDNLSPGDRALWLNRVKIIISTFIEMLE